MSQAGATIGAGSTRGRVMRARLASFLQRQGALVALVLLAVFATARYERFLTEENLTNVLRQNSMLGLVALGMTFVILTGGIDLSVGSLVAVAGVVAAGLAGQGVLVAVGGGKVTVWRREGKDERVLASADAPQSEMIYLRMTAEGGERYRFAFGANGREWTELGGAVEGGYIESARVALTAAGGAARFDWVKIK